MNYSSQYVQRLAGKLHQMDARFNNLQNRWGCLFFTCISIANDNRSAPATYKECEAIYQRAENEGAIKGKVFVQSTSHVINIALDELGLWPRYEAIELYRESDGDIQRITNSDANTTDLILELNVTTAGGHFVHADLDETIVYDPSPDLALGDIRSRRFIAVVPQ